MTMNRMLVLPAGMLFLACGTVSGQDYYVDQINGSTSNPGTESEPFEDIDQCAAVVGPGDTCFIRNGTYSRGLSAYEPKQSGTSEAPIIYAAAPGHAPIITVDGVAPAIGTGCDNGYVDYFVLDGLRIDGTVLAQGCSTFDRVLDFKLRNCEVFNGSYSDDGNWSGVFLQNVVNAHVHDNEIHHIDNGSGNGAAIRFFRGRGTLIEHNYIHSNINEGAFDKEGSEDNVWRRNIWENNGAVNLKVNNQPDQVTGVYNERTKVYENIFICDSGNVAATRPLVQATDLEFYNNTVYMCDGVSSFGNGDGTELNTGLKVYNNIFIGGQYALDFQRWDANEPELSDHNLFQQTSIIENRYSPPGDEPSETHPDLDSWISRHPEYDANSLEIGPQFVDPPADFHLSPGSPARLAGMSGEDLGAYPRGDDGTIIGPRPSHTMIFQDGFEASGG